MISTFVLLKENEIIIKVSKR